MKYAFALAVGLALCTFDNAVAQPPPGAVGDPFLHRIHILNCVPESVMAWVQVKDVKGHIHQVPRHGHGAEATFYPNQSSAHVWADQVIISVWDGQSFDVRTVKFNAGPNTRRYTIERQGNRLVLIEH
jgi:hypothetical protein